MRKADPLGDVGRVSRQQQVVSKVVEKAADPSLLYRPWSQVKLIRAGTGALSVDQDASIFDIGRLMLDFKAATGPEGVQGVPTIQSLDYQPGGIGSAVLLDPEASKKDFQQIRDGSWKGGAQLP
jgi:anionic cell wall polymer biosynthesis LytR-Cps2A-Psr (LCP) family protein